MSPELPHPRFSPFGAFVCDKENIGVSGFCWFESIADLVEYLIETAHYFQAEKDGKHDCASALRSLAEAPGAGDSQLKAVKVWVRNEGDPLGIEWCGHVRELLESDCGARFREDFREGECDDYETGGDSPIQSSEEEGFLQWLSEYVCG